MSSQETVTLMVGDEQELFHVANIASDDQIDRITVRHQSHETIAADDLHSILESVRHAGFTHRSPKHKIWVALPPPTAPTTDVVFLDDRDLTPKYPYVGITMNKNPRTGDGKRVEVHVDFLSLCVQSVFDPSIRKAAEHVANYRVLTFLAWFPRISESAYATILHGTHPVFSSPDDYFGEGELIITAAHYCPGDLLTQFVKTETTQFWSDLTGASFQTEEEKLEYQKSMKRYFHIVNAAIHRTDSVDWDKICAVLVNAAEKHGVVMGRTYALIANRSRLAELTSTFRKAITDPFPESTASDVLNRLAKTYGHRYAIDVLAGVLSNPYAHSSTLEFFAYGDVPELRAAVAGNPSVPIRMRTALITTI